MRPESLPKFDSVEEQFKYGSVGIESEEGIPYWIWQVLPRVFADKLPRPGGYAAFGFQWEPRTGTACRVFQSGPLRWPARRDQLRVLSYGVGPHERARAARLIAAGPGNQINPQAYVKFLQAVADDPRFDSGQLLDAIAGLTQALVAAAHAVSLPAHPRREAGAQEAAARARLDVQESRVGAGSHRSVQPRQVRHAEAARGQTIGNSDMVPIWNMKARQGMSLHWDGLSASLREVVLSSALGDGASRKSISWRASRASSSG